MVALSKKCQQSAWVALFMSKIMAQLGIDKQHPCEECSELDFYAN